MSKEIDFERIEKTIEAFVEQARRELKERWEKWTIDLSQNEIYEVVGALLARQVTLARQIAESPSIWNEHAAPVMLRAMADTYISLAWVLKDPLNRAQRFILYGLGQAKLLLEHQKSRIGERQPTPEEKLLLDAHEAWINSQRFTFLTEVNVGSWSGIPTRQMAEEADCLDFYNFVYNPFSACAHSTWYHIARYNLKQCSNPLHRYHLVPEDHELPSSPDYLYLSAKYLQKSFAVFDRTFSVQFDGQSAFDCLRQELQRLSGTESSNEA